MQEVGVRLKVGATGTEEVSKVTKALRDMGVDTTLLDSKLGELDASLRDLGTQQGLIDSFKRQKDALAGAATAMDAAKAEASKLGKELAGVETPTKAQAKAFDQARTAARNADQAYTEQRVKLQALRGEMTTAGVSTDSLAAAQRRVNQQTDAAKAALAGTADWAGRLAAAQRTGATAADQAAAALKREGTALGQMGKDAQQATAHAGDLGDKLKGLAQIGVAGILGSQTAQMLRGVAETADAYANLQAKVKLATGEGAAFATAWQGVADVAQRTSSNLETTGELFAKLAATGKDAGLSTEQASAQALALTETINQAVQLSGASAQAASAAITQLVQGLQSGVLRGDEFNSVMEQAPRLAKALANGLGLTTGELRKMAEAGKLSADTVIKALKSQSDVLQKEFGALPATIGRSLENLRTKWALLVGDLNKGSGATAAVASGIDALANNLDELAGIAARAGTVLVAALAVQGVQSLRSLSEALANSGGAVGVLTKRLDEVPKAVNITVAVIGLEIGYQLGQLLYENSSLARKLGIGIVQYFAVIVDGLQLAAEAAKAIFTDDTVTKAFERYTKRAEDQKKIFAQMYSDAEKAPEKVGDAANKASDASTELARKAKEAADKIALAGDAGAAGITGIAKAAETAAQAIGELVASANTTLPELGEVAAQQAAKITAIGQAGAVAAQSLVEALPKAIQKLNGPELEQFRERMVGALSAAEEASRSLAARLAADGKDNRATLADADRAAFLLKTTLAAIGEQAAKSLGVDVATATGKVTEGFKTAQVSLETLIKALPALKAAGVDAGTVVGEALAKMIDGAKNQAELDAVIARVKALRDTLGARLTDGLLDQATTKAEGLRTALDNVKPGINSVDEAMRKLGLTTSTVLKQAARDAQDAYAVIKREGQAEGESNTAWLERKRAAATVMVEKMIAANRGFIEEATRAKAAQEGVTLEVDKFGKASVEAFEKAKTSVEKYKAALDGVYQAQVALDAYGPGAANGGVGGFSSSRAVLDRSASGASSSGAGTTTSASSGGSGVRLDSTDIGKGIQDRLNTKSGTIGSTYTPPPDNSGIWEWVPDASRGGIWQIAGNGIKGSKPFTVPSFNYNGTPAAASPTQQPAPTTTVHNVVVDLSGGGVPGKRINVASDADAVDLAAWAQAVVNAARAAGQG